jgi:hypothetical protein
MEEFIDKCMYVLKEGMTLGTDGLFISYIGNDIYIVQDPVLPECDTEEGPVEIRRRLEEYYISHPMEMEMDRDYIEERIGSAV